MVVCSSVVVVILVYGTSRFWADLLFSGLW